MTVRCRLCRSSVETIVDGGLQPFSNRFLMSSSEDEARHPMTLGLCPSCGLVQLMKPAAAHDLRSRFDWIRYNEPEDHLDTLATTLLNFTGNDTSMVVGALSYKDDSLLNRLAGRGMTRTWRIRPDTQLGIETENSGIETVQQRISSIHRGDLNISVKADILLVRHILEHVHDIHGFFSSLKHWVTPGGYMLIEVPCCDSQMEQFDYSMIWEEHVSCFTPATFKRCLSIMGLSLRHVERVHYPLEDVLIGIFQLLDHNEENGVEDATGEINRARAYGQRMPDVTLGIKRALARFREKGQVVVFGAGHMACSFVNLHGLADQIDCFLDDNPNKVGRFMPGSRRPIYTSNRLETQSFSLCLLALNPSLDDKIINRFKGITSDNTVFHSIFPGSRYALNSLKTAII